MKDRVSRVVGLAVIFLLMAFTANPAVAAVATRMGLAPSGYIGWDVDRTTGAAVCLVSSHDECGSPTRSSRPGGFAYPQSVAADPRTGDIYVAEDENERVQELTASGAFVSMLGWGVNETDDALPRVAQARKNICTAKSKDRCGAGIAGTHLGQFDSPASVAVDPTTGDIYVLNIGVDDLRVDKYTRAGRFVWRIGGGVDRKSGGNLCSAKGVDLAGAGCVGGAPDPSDSAEHGAFDFAGGAGDLLAVDGARHLLYVGDEHRVQVFGTDGKWRSEIPLVTISAQAHSSVVALALEEATGELYVVYRAGQAESYSPTEGADVVHKFNADGAQVAEYSVDPRAPGAVDGLDAIAVDSRGQLAVMGVEVGPGASGRFGSLYKANTGDFVAEFSPPVDDDGLAFNGAGDLYVATAVDQEVDVYAPVLVQAPLTGSVPCSTADETRARSAIGCALLAS